MYNRTELPAQSGSNAFITIPNYDEPRHQSATDSKTWTNDGTKFHKYFAIRYNKELINRMCVTHLNCRLHQIVNIPSVGVMWSTINLTYSVDTFTINDDVQVLLLDAMVALRFAIFHFHSCS